MLSRFLGRWKKMSESCKMNGKMNDMDEFWREHSKSFLKVDDLGYGAVCYTGMPLWLNEFVDKYQRKVFFQLTKGLSLRDKRILDVGCGVGRWTRLFSKFSKNVVGVDIDEIRLGRAREISSLDIDFRRMFVNEMDFDDGSFDVVNSITVLQHMPYREKFRAIEEMGRVIKKGGFAIVVELSDMFDDDRHVFPMRRLDWVGKFEKAGFKLVRERGFEYIPILRFLRWLRYVVCGRKTISKKGGSAKLSFFEWFVLRAVVLLSYPIESFCSTFLDGKFARHSAFLFRKVK